MTQRRRLLPFMLLLIAGVVGACGTAPSATSAIAPSEGSGPGATPRSAEPTASPKADQTDTDRGRIWDTLPKGFPVYAGATRSEETDIGPATAVLVIEGAKATDVVGWYQEQLTAAGFRTDAMTGPMEDGGFTLDTSGKTTDCRLEVRVVPMGAGSDFLAITVMYGADCPKP
jgi:hypothetical protein